MKLDLILRIGTKLILPFILLFALYVHFHGDYGPGGGFQAGVIAAGMLILHALVFGVRATKRIAPQRVVETMVPLGVLVYASAGLPALFKGMNYLNYAAYDLHHPAHGHHLGILLVESGVIITVFSTMVAIFYAFSERGRA
ncbi:MAG: Na(+)/H(+) antiporter subunit B [Hyphomicrobiaceae bacterium]